jgi:hypothetical protein
MASHNWVAEKAIPYLMKDANMGAKNGCQEDAND